MKKGLVILLSMVMLFSLVLVGCQNADDTKTTANTDQSTDAKKDSSGGQEASAPDLDVTEKIEYSYLICWNGGGAGFPTEETGGSIYQAFVDKTGVVLKVETIVTSEREKLATIFASGDVPDIVNAPYWNTNPGGEGELIKNAAVDGLVLPLNGLYEQFPNVKRAMEEGISATFKTMHVEHPEFDGERYVIPHQTPRTNDDVRNWAYNLFARGDIMEDLGIAPESVTTQDDVYNLMVAIKNGGYVNITQTEVDEDGTLCIFFDGTVLDDESAMNKYMNGEYVECL